MNRPRRLLAALGIVAVGALAQCNNHNQPFDGGTDPPTPTCVDHDGDGYGVSCDLGFDCNDYDPGVTWPCDPADPCARPAEGCPCSFETETIPCRTAEPIESEDGTLSCYSGSRTCRGGVWSACEGMEPYTMGESGSDDDGVRREPILGFPETCVAGCDAACRTIHDCPSQRDLGPGISDNMMYDAIHPPPAIILEDLADPGTFRRRFQAECARPQFEAFTWWGVNWQRHPDYFCDLVPPQVPCPCLDVAAPARLTVRVRTAPTEAELGTATGTAWFTVVDCPTVNCTNVSMADRGLSTGNIYSELIGAGVSAVRNPWLEYEVTMTANGAPVSPRFTSIDFFFFCDEAT